MVTTTIVIHAANMTFKYVDHLIQRQLGNTKGLQNLKINEIGG